MSLGNSSKWHCSSPTCPAGKSSMWLTQSVDLSKARAGEESCSDIRRGSSVLWAKVWVTSPSTENSGCQPGLVSLLGSMCSEGAAEHSAQNISERTTTMYCQILPYFWAVPMLKFGLQKLGVHELCVPVKPSEIKLSSDYTGLPGLGETRPWPLPNLITSNSSIPRTWDASNAL